MVTEFKKTLDRINNRYQKALAHAFFRRNLRLDSPVPIISFTFDDFPRSALLVGGQILEGFGCRASFYAAMGLMGGSSVLGETFIPDDLFLLLEKGHELGCHSFGHLDPWKTKPAAYNRSILQNIEAVRNILPNFLFRTFSYPYRQPHPLVKKRVARHFSCCRGGGQKSNVANADLSLLKAAFLEKERERPDFAKNLIDNNCNARGWLIFVTHDISSTPSLFGCHPKYFEEIVNYAIRSGAKVLPVFQAYTELTSIAPHIPNVDVE